MGQGASSEIVNSIPNEKQKNGQNGQKFGLSETVDKVGNLTQTADATLKNVNKAVENHIEGKPVSLKVEILGLGNRKLVFMLYFLCLFFLIGFIVCLIGWITCKNKDNFKHVNEKETVVFFSQSGCGYCTQFKPIWDRVSDSKNYNFVLVDLSKDNNSTLFQSLTDAQIGNQAGSPRGVPTVIKFSGPLSSLNSTTKTKVYSEARTEISFRNWLKS